MAIVIINNIANIIGSIVVGAIAENEFGQTSEYPALLGLSLQFSRCW